MGPDPITAPLLVQFQIKIVDNFGKNEAHLRVSQVLADAVPGAKTKWLSGEPIVIGKFGGRVSKPAVGNKVVGAGKVGIYVIGCILLDLKGGLRSISTNMTKVNEKGGKTRSTYTRGYPLPSNSIPRRRHFPVPKIWHGRIDAHPLVQHRQHIVQLANTNQINLIFAFEFASDLIS